MGMGSDYRFSGAGAPRVGRYPRFATHLRRYSKFVVLAAGAIVCLIPLWFAFAHLVDLLPSNI